MVFRGEEGVDAGGLTREWYECMAKEIFNPGYYLFKPSIDGATFQPNPLCFQAQSVVTGENYYKFCGRFVGKARCDGQAIDAHFTRSFFATVPSSGEIVTGESAALLPVMFQL